MNISSEALNARLESEIGAGSIESDSRALSAYVVDGKTPALLCLPSAPEQVSSVLRVCGEADASVVPWGGGTAMNFGNVPRRVDVVIGLEKLAKLIEHDDANLTATVQAGMRVASFQEIVAQRRQFLPVDPPLPLRATIGGTVAANVNGPRRMLYGGVRDLVVGMKMALATGEQIKSGGKVVKNVAGYDLCKLFVGSLGTLGIITEVTLRVAPMPESAASFLASGTPDECARFLEQLSRSPLLPAAVTVLSADAAKIPGRELRTPVIATWVEGFEEAIARHLGDLENMARLVGLTGEVLRGKSHEQLWEQIRNFCLNDEEVLYRMIVPAGSLAEVLAAVSRSDEFGMGARYIADAMGTVWILPEGKPASVNCFSKLAALARDHRGHVTIAAAPTELKTGIDVWGPAPPSLDLMREIKRQFDPRTILNPGRFLAGL